MKILLAIKPSQSENQQLVASLLYRRALQSFQGAVLMAERGMIADALTLVRSCAETAIAIGSVAGDEKFVDVLVEAHDEAILTYSNVLLNDPESRQFFTSEQINNLKQTVAEIRSKYSGSGPRRIKWTQAAINAKMTALYDTIYRMTSGDASHTTVDALDRHVEPDEHGKIGKLTFRPKTRQLEQTLSFATNALLHAMEAITRVFPREDFERMVKSCENRWQNLNPEFRCITDLNAGLEASPCAAFSGKL
jgi:hypothetical protein